MAGAISRKGGNIIQEKSNDYVKKHGEVPTGSCGLTGAGKLPCEYVIHAVGPIWNSSRKQENFDQLKSAVLSVLDKANTLKPKKGKDVSVSIPAISSGIFGFPKPKCAEIMLTNTIKWCLLNKKSKVTLVRLTNFDEETRSIFQETFEKL